MPSKRQHHDDLFLSECIKFCEEIENLISESNKKADERERETGKPTIRFGYVEAVLTVSERWKIEPDFAAEYLNPTIKSHLQREWQNLHRLPKKGKLPFD